MRTYQVFCGDMTGSTKAKTPKDAAIQLLFIWRFQLALLSDRLSVKSRRQPELYFWTEALLDTLNENPKLTIYSENTVSKPVAVSIPTPRKRPPLVLCIA